MTCSICSRPIEARGWCRAHYYKWRKYGDPLAGGRPRGISEAEAFAWYMPGNPPFAPSLSEGCWDWSGYTDPNGYGRFGMNHTHVSAHVASHRIYNLDDPITEEKPFVLHSCDRPICVQPAHLHAGNNADNMIERSERNRTAHGERSGPAKLTESDVLWIRAQTSMTNQDIADIMGVTQPVICVLRKGKTWKHLL